MKIRTDFVTNSSSSSFILAFDNENSITQELLNDNTNGEFETILEDVMRCKSEKTREKVLAEYKGYIKDKAIWKAQEYIMRKKNLGWIESYNYLRANSDETNEIVDTIVKEKIKELEEKIQGKHIVVIVEYEDCDKKGSRLEHEILPNMNSCKAIINHH